jgi:DNA processing protein
MKSAAGILQLLHARGVGPRTMDRLLKALRELGGTPADLPATPPRDLVSRAGLKPDLVDTIENERESALHLADELDANEIRLLIKGFDSYPGRLVTFLGDAAPPVLFVKGDLGILDKPSVAFAGSRKASEKGLLITANAGDELARARINIVSGYANGVDLVAHRAALQAGGATTLVLAEGILHFRAKSTIADLLQAGNYLVVSEFPPRLKWLARNAMQRNRTICALADAILIIESGRDGGTFAAAQTAQELGRPIFVVDFANPPPSAEGNPHLIELGAAPLRGDGNGRANLDGVFKVLELDGSVSSHQAPPLPAAAIAAYDHDAINPGEGV